jgi:hypothetical protein
VQPEENEYSKQRALNISRNLKVLGELVEPLLGTCHKATYNDGYWLSTGDISFITYCLVNVKAADDLYPSPTAVDVMVDKLMQLNLSKDVPYQCQIVNTDSRSKSGKHWVLFIWACQNRCLKVHIWDPYPHTQLSAAAYKDTKAKLTEKINQLNRKTKKSKYTIIAKLRGIGLQVPTDTFGCGYFMVWVKLILTPYFANGGSIDDWNDTHSVDGPPKTWFTLVYRLLAVRDMQPDGHSAKNINLRSLWQEALATGRFKLSKMLSKIKEYHATIQVM